MINRFHKTLLSFASLLKIDIYPLTQVWSDIYFKRRKHRGKADAVKFMKELNTVAERYALHQPIEPIRWTKSDKNGFPIVLNKFKPYLRSSDNFKVIMALSVMRTVELLRLPISKDISTVVDRSKASATVINNVIDFIPSWLNSFKPIKLKEMKYHVTIKNGPNGHALKSSDSDISAVMRSPKLLRAILTVQDKLNDKHPMEIDLMDLISHQGSIHSKLTQFPEKSGKTRTIAVVDYYSQRCLKPLHEGIMALLSKMVSDGTYSHFNVGKFAQQKTKEKSFIACYDLSAATDRFPREIQQQLLFELIKDKQLAASLWTLLAERTFKVAWSGEQVTYNCGQPMGAYSSWPLFALAHHLLVEYSAYQAGTKQIKDKYRLIGDDVIITDQRTAKYYQENMSALGVEINLDKTVSSLRHANKSCAEVAKQLYLNGRNLTPLTPGFINDLRKPYMFNTCMELLNERYNIQDTITPSVIIEKFFPKKKSFAKTWLLTSDPISGVIKPSDEGYDNNSPWADKDIGLAKEVRAIAQLPTLQEQARKLVESISTDDEAVSGTSTDRPTHESRAIPYVLSSIKEQILETERGLFPTNLQTIQEILDSFSYMPDPMIPFMERKELKCKRLASFKELIFKELPVIIDEPTKEDEFESWTWVEDDDDFADIPTLDSW
jgi:hypothetical protein